jgi:signal transduction histidine kinase
VSSLRARLTLGSVLVVGPVVALVCAAFYFTVAGAAWRQVDREVVETARVFANLAEFDREDGFELEGGAEIASLLAESSEPTHVRIDTPAGILLDSEVLAAQVPAGLPPRLVDAPGELTQELRAVGLVVRPRTDPGGSALGPVTVLVARDTSHLRQRLRDLAVFAWICGGGTLLLAGAVAVVGVRRGLRPVVALGERIESIRDLEGDTRLHPERLPDELRPLAAQLESLLGRLRDSLARERRFTANVAHELRTPLAVLRMSADVALQGDHAASDHRRRWDEVRGELEGMTRRVEDLLLLARAEGHHLVPRRERVALDAVVQRAVAAAERIARERDITVQVGDLRGRCVTADPEHLAMIVTNLVANAVDYGRIGSVVRVDPGDAERTLLAVRDATEPLPEEALARAFEPFWRGQDAGASSGHAGLGLPLARALARLQGLDLVMRNEDSGDGVVAELVTSA